MISKKLVNDQAIKSLCEGVLFPQAELSLRLRAVLLQGIVIVYSRQTMYLVKDVKDVLKSFNDAVLKPAAHINMVEGAARDLTVRPPADTDFFVDPADVQLVDLEEAVRGDGGSVGGGGGGRGMLEPELVVGDYAELSIRREDITLAPDEASGAVVSAAAAASLGDDVLLGGFDFQMDGQFDVDVPLDVELPVDMGTNPQPQNQHPQPGNELLDQIRFDEHDDRATPRRKRGVNSVADNFGKRKRAANMGDDRKTRLEAAVLREWLTLDRITAVERPELPPVVATASKGGDPYAFGIEGVNSSLQSFFGGLWREHAESGEDGSEHESSHDESGRDRRSRAMSIERARDDGGLVPMDMDWGDALMADEQQQQLQQQRDSDEGPARVSDARMPSVSPARPGRSSVFSDHSSEDAAARGFVLPVDSPQREGGEEGDVRTFQLKMLMRRQFDSETEAGRVPAISFDAFTSTVRKRKALANVFYHVLLLASQGQIKVSQDQAYGDIVMQQQKKF